MSAVVSAFFAPANPKRPANFVVIKYLLLGLLISNSIESILIIPKILDVLDQNKMQHHRLETADIQRAEVKELVAAKEARQREIDELDNKERTELIAERVGERTGKKPGHHEGKSEHHAPAVRKRPQREDTGTNVVAVFMLFYGAVTLTLGIPALFKEMHMLIAALMCVSIVGIVVLISAGFSLIMLMSVTKDCIIVILSYKYREMIVQSDAIYASEVAAAGGSAAAPVDYAQQQQAYPGQQQ